MSMDEESPIKTLTIYETTRGNQDDVFYVDPRDDTIDKSPKPIKELINLQHGPKPRQNIQLNKDLTSIICHKLVICPQAKQSKECRFIRMATIGYVRYPS